MRRPRTLLAICTLAAFPLLWGAVALAALPKARPGHPVLVIGGIATPAARIAHLAGGYPVGLAAGPLGQVFHSHQPDFLARLRDGGAFLLLDAERLSFLTCGSDA